VASSSGQRTSESSAFAANIAARSLSNEAAPIRYTALFTVMPNSARSFFATPPAATRAVVSRALERSRTFLRSSKAYFCIPARSACPGEAA
jgi:hypothetical protein